MLLRCHDTYMSCRRLLLLPRFEDYFYYPRFEDYFLQFFIGRQ